ncbi:Chitin bind 4 domain containing protein [Asbolus verrucosus]|uniref:Chitin bind 4 domain containing protein n=1 Tax=Asbolus verrucosus TaxID=1661398 RepID=A0A482WDI7_ASBVE|nr:Chitin bind 4 domain containing protein [Asbolus verrucosus]
MKNILILLGILGIVAARPQFGFNLPSIVKYDFDNLGFGGFSFSVETSDGFKHDQSGQTKNAGTPDEALAVTGSYSYVGDDGKTYMVKYTADENGFQPEGEHLPPSAGVKKLGVPSSCVASLCGGGIG